MTPQQTEVILHRLDEQDKTLGRIETHVTETNGRVTRLELQEAVRQDREQRHSQSLGWRMTVLAGGLGMLSSVVGYIALAVFHLHG